ncbi:hypothetical protein V8D89_001020 [Ganoderma adspersum]
MDVSPISSSSATRTQSHAHSISNGTYPGKDYQEVYPPADTAADSGFQWQFYLGLYSNYTIWNYAVGGAVFTNALTPLCVPDVAGQQAWFVQDHIAHNGTRDQKLLLDPASFVIVLFRVDVTLPDVADCQLDALRVLYALGTRRFTVNSLIPLQLTGQYGGSSAAVIYYPFPPRNRTAWDLEMTNLALSLNRILHWHDGVRALDAEWRGGGSSVQWFDTYRLFEEIIPANLTGH